MEQILTFIDNIQTFLWTHIVITLLVGSAIYFTWRLRGVQFLQLREMMRLLLSSGTVEKNAQSNGKRHVNSFQAFAVSLSSRVGTGNLAGVASAIAIGGPGAVFWMWVMALLGASTAFMEATLAQLFKRKGDDAFYGGPAYYMQYGLHCRWMGVLFASLITFGFGIANQIVQSNTLCDALGTAWGYDPARVAMILTVMTLAIIFGGIQRISHFSAIVVPFMAVGYLLLTIFILAVHISEVPSMLRLIIENAFGVRQAAGGAVGMAILQGVKRGLFSNEAGEGSAPNAAATASTSHPVKQGMIQALGVFTDTLVICTCTAFVIILSGLYGNGQDGIILTGSAMEHFLGLPGRWFLSAAIFLFAYSTIIANYFYGETNIRFISQSRKPIFVFRLFTGVTVLLGGYMTLQEAFCIVDLAMALMVITNMVAVLLLSRHATCLLRNYMQQRKEGKDPSFHRQMMSDISDDIQCWD
ncbi:MAG: alanine/glycine:cation symporter family protein [Bacteroidaceae bacterium]